MYQITKLHSLYLYWIFTTVRIKQPFNMKYIYLLYSFSKLVLPFRPVTITVKDSVFLWDVTRWWMTTAQNV